MMKRRRVLSGVLVAAMAVAMAFPAAGTVSRAAEPDDALIEVLMNPQVKIEAKDNKVPMFQVGQSQKWTLVVRNLTDETLKDIIVSPDMGEDTLVWPFRSDYQNYEKKIDSLEPKKTAEVTFEFTQREDAGSSRYAILFSAVSGKEELARQKLYVNTSAKPEPEPAPEPAPAPAENPMPAEPDNGGAVNTDAFYDGGSVGGGGGADSASTSVPRVIVTGFSTNPAEVRAGTDFVLTIHLKNTSKKVKVQNMLFDLSATSEGKDEQSMAPAFLPTSGSSAIYLDGIKADGTADISIGLTAKADLFQKPYSVDLSMKYEDANGGQVDSSSSLSIPVKQDARFEFSDFEISPSSIEVGSEANVMCSLYNLGRIKLYNVKAIFEGKGIEREEIFIGNIESGATGSIDAMLTGVEATEGPELITMTLTYEDESGKVSSTTQELELEVTELMDMEGDVDMADFEDEPQKSGFPILPIAILVAAIAGIAGIVAFVKVKKKKKMSSEEEELMDEVGGSSEDEWK